ncbi:hypothetical protein [Teredinibacter turnerae]|uniref:Uncharacterized protein n=1 Tax=Teredinibacter turnerae (strain ATCC 39867 / T7901) TaxID=377629 RepID=C5BTG2_TERTT|nr:hypothetical protein [Teredinibacter turnerae]ACR13816.1 conserved hypothetical protein [Teredinibacter turnerae T7901]
MDLQEFSAEMLYFQEEINPAIEELVAQAASNYGPQSEELLKEALAIDSGNLLALIGLYRFYYYQNRYADGVEIAHQVMSVVGERIEFPANWRDISMYSVVNGLTRSFCLVRLYFFALKAAGYLHLRMSHFEEGREMLEKVVAMDSADRVGARLLLQVLDNNKADVLSFPGSLKQEAC